MEHFKIYGEVVNFVPRAMRDSTTRLQGKFLFLKVSAPERRGNEND